MKRGKRFHILDVAIASQTSNIPQNDIGNYVGFYSELICGEYDPGQILMFSTRPSCRIAWHGAPGKFLV